ncbi:MAG: aspartyl protease family protein [Acidobacteriota bacterium]
MSNIGLIEAGIARRPSRPHKACAFVLVWLCLGTVAWGGENQYQRAQKELAAGNFTRAEEIYRELINRKPKDVNAYLGLSLLLLKQRNLQSAYDEANKVLALEPRNARAHALAATALLRSGYFLRAIEHLRVALLVDGREDLALVSAAEIDLYESRVEQAFQRLRAAVREQPDEPDYWLVYARAASRLEQFKEAANALSQFLRYAPKTDNERRARIQGVIKFYNYLDSTNIYELKGEKNAAIPLEIRSRRPYLQVRINGKETLRFVIDTGSGITVLSAQAAQRLGVREVARGGNAHAVGGEGSFPIVYGVVDRLDLGGIRVETVPVYIREIHVAPNAVSEDIADGYLGLAVLSNFLITLDYKAGEMRLDVLPEEKAVDIPTPTNALQTVVPFRTTESGLISVETRLDEEETLNFIFDSGASISVISAAVIEEKKWQSKILSTQTKVVGAAGITNDVKLMRAGKLRIADLVRENLRIAVLNLNRLNEHAGFEQQGILGGDFLNHCRIQIDFRRLRLVLTPYESGVLKRVSEVIRSQAEGVK